MPRAFSLLALLVVLAVVAAGCRSGGSDDDAAVAIPVATADDVAAVEVVAVADAAEPDDGDDADDTDAEAAPEDDAAELTIVSHSQERRVNESTVVIGGFSEPGSLVTVNSLPASMEADGRWSIEIELEEGANLARFHSVDALGNETERALVLHYEKELAEEPTVEAPKVGGVEEPVKDEATSDGKEEGTFHEDKPLHEEEPVHEEKPAYEEEPVHEDKPLHQEEPAHEEKPLLEEPVHDEKPVQEEIAFSAEQLYGFCEEEVAYDVFFGRGTPGSLVKVLSEYGDGQVEVDQSGHWELKVFFPEAPANTVFQVKVTDGEQHTYFEFVHKVVEPVEHVVE